MPKIREMDSEDIEEKKQPKWDGGSSSEDSDVKVALKNTRNLQIQ